MSESPYTAALTKQAELTLDISKGDTLLGGRFKNSPLVVEEIGTDELGQPTVNGRKLLAYRIKKKMPEKSAAVSSPYFTELVKQAYRVVIPVMAGAGIGHLTGAAIHRRRSRIAGKDPEYASWWSDPRNKYRMIGGLLGLAGGIGGVGYAIHADDKRMQAEMERNRKESDEYWRKEKIDSAVRQQWTEAEGGYRHIKMMEADRRSRRNNNYSPDELKEYLAAARRVEQAKIRAEQISTLGNVDVPEHVVDSRMKAWDANPVVRIPAWLDEQIVDDANITAPPPELRLK